MLKRFPFAFHSKSEIFIVSSLSDRSVDHTTATPKKGDNRKNNKSFFSLNKLINMKASDVKFATKTIIWNKQIKKYAECVIASDSQ